MSNSKTEYLFAFQSAPSDSLIAIDWIGASGTRGLSTPSGVSQPPPAFATGTRNGEPLT